MVAQPFGQGNALLAQICSGVAVSDAASEHVRTGRRVYPGGMDVGEMTALGDPALDAVPAGPAAVMRCAPLPGARSAPLAW